MSAQTPIRSLVIRASAGAGNTYRLTQKIYEALLAPGAAEHPERLLAMTFARAAAGEIRDRVLRELAEAATDDAGFERHRAKLPAGTQREDVRRLLLALIARLDRLRIGTIDAFFMTLARSYAFDLEMPANWRIGDELELSDLRLQALEDVWAELRMPVMAKLDMAVKYTAGGGGARLISEALPKWETAAALIKTREEALRAHHTPD